MKNKEKVFLSPKDAIKWIKSTLKNTGLSIDFVIIPKSRPYWETCFSDADDVKYRGEGEPETCSFYINGEEVATMEGERECYVVIINTSALEKLSKNEK